MHKNPVWLCFLTLVFLVTGIYTLKTFATLYDYLRLSNATEAAATAWSISSEKEDAFVPLARYTFQAGGKFYHGETLFLAETAHNPWAAEESLKDLAVAKHRVWYSASSPAYSSMEKTFPLKQTISAAVLWALCVYFFWLGAYVAKLQQRG